MLVEASTVRWGIEQCFEDGKGYVGIGKYEHRSWPAWHRHMIYVFLALQFLLRLQLRFKKTPALTLPQAHRLVAAVFPHRSLTFQRVNEIVIRVAMILSYKSNRKKRLAMSSLPTVLLLKGPKNDLNKGEY